MSEFTRPVESAAKGGNLDECVNTNVLCYECDSRFDANCGDPFGEPTAPITYTPISTTTTTTPISTNSPSSDIDLGSTLNLSSQTRANTSISQINSTSPSRKKLKQLPPVQVCHGCCVKLTSKLSNGVPYVKRMCISNLSINYFMVGLVCMKESGDRGRLCFCETDYCNSQPTKFQPNYPLIIISLLVFILYSSAKGNAVISVIVNKTGNAR